MGWIWQNSFGVDTVYGWRAFEILCGDITSPPERSDMDPELELLVVSAFRGDYTPTDRSVIGALHRRGINVGELARRPALDLRVGLGTWVSEPLPQPDCYQRLVCVELDDARRIDLAGTLRDLFGVLTIFEGREGFRNGGSGAPESYGVTLPMLASGDQALPQERVLAALVPAARQALHASPWLQRVRFVAYSTESASEFARALDRELGRENAPVSKEDLMRSACKEILSGLGSIPATGPHGQILSEVQHAMEAERLQPYQVGTVARKVSEVVTGELIRKHCKKKPSHTHAENISKLEGAGVASWMINYLNVLRVFGNENVHLVERERRPLKLEDKDMTVALFCLQRVLAFWAAECGPPPSGAKAENGP